MKNVQTRSLKTQSRILDATRRLFEEKGCRNVTAEMIAQASGVAKGTVFAHFQDKSNLIAAVGMEEMKAAMAQMQALASAERNDTLANRVLRLFDPLLLFFSGNPDFAHLFINQSAFDQGPWSKQFQKSCQQFEDSLAAYLIEEEIEDENISVGLMTSGVQAFFLQILTYRVAGWIETDQAAREKFRAYLDVWFRDAGGKIG
ncbi:MAG: TetR/AcrR family transcriptional regulator [Sneathiellales bacterium]|nr:TetR/AcrR family transcriptional regulator [Sneathiellales bacterium]